MNLRPLHKRRCSGILLVECLVYLTVFTVLLTGATTVFYYCWDSSTALISQTEQIHAALTAGERWRADIRAATGTIAIDNTGDGETVKIPEGQTEIDYHFDNNQVSRQIGTAKAIVLTRVKTSDIQMDARGAVTAWRWELELTPRRSETHLSLSFTFEAVPPKP